MKHLRLGKISLLLIINLYLAGQTVFALPYWVEGYDPTAVYSAVGERGNTGYNYVMVSPVKVADGEHVNSIYTFRDWFQTRDNWDLKPDFVEIGWGRKWGWSYSKAFWAFSENGNYYGGPNGLIQNLSAGQTVSFKVAVDVPQTTPKPNWWWIINGTKKLSYQVWFGKGTPMGGSEKLKRGDSNYAHWWGLKLKRSQGDYRNWNLVGKLGNTDPDGYYLNASGSNAFYVQK